ncbi:hypothetical protein CMV_010424 [Castanea mollissima]|uniref:Uncharacterized protein n=1 Tax=Castanea mollissima TaxID=60419 RepID=A0A8J4R5H2_9ROSI|nr:hypothetical protein CMV_010424 [Castanea mollissima]
MYGLVSHYVLYTYQNCGKSRHRRRIETVLAANTNGAVERDTESNPPHQLLLSSDPFATESISSSPPLPYSKLKFVVLGAKL